MNPSDPTTAATEWAVLRQQVCDLVWRYPAYNRHLEPTVDDIMEHIDAYAHQQVEAVLARARNTVEECGAVGDHDDDYYHGYDQAIQDAAAAIRALAGSKV